MTTTDEGVPNGTWVADVQYEFGNEAEGVLDDNVLEAIAKKHNLECESSGLGFGKRDMQFHGTEADVEAAVCDFEEIKHLNVSSYEDVDYPDEDDD